MKESAVAGILLALLLFTMSWMQSGRENLPEAQPDRSEPQQLEAQVPQIPTGKKDEDILLQAKIDGEIQTVTMADYLPGVVRGEMLPSFEEDALKAQAVAERTYICYQMLQGAKPTHPEADVCDNAACCSAYMSPEEAQAKWGKKYAEYDAKIQAAVKETDGVIMLYEEMPIMAVFHSSSAGVTAACEDVWSANLPYLVSVKSPETAANVPNYYSVKSFSPEEFCQIFLAAHPEADFTGEWIADLTENGSGRVDHITVGGVTVSGSEMRSLYGLRSNSFTVETGEQITFRVTGYGHGVGMSQYGAQELATQGKSWQEILQWYYTDISFGGYTNE